MFARQPRSGRLPVPNKYARSRYAVSERVRGGYAPRGAWRLAALRGAAQTMRHDSARYESAHGVKRLRYVFRRNSDERFEKRATAIFARNDMSQRQRRRWHRRGGGRRLHCSASSSMVR